jgi:hypothetical protein
MGITLEGFVPSTSPPAVVQFLVLALVDGDAKQPRGELGITTEVAHRAKSTQEDVLCDFFSQRPVAQLSKTDRKDTVLIAADQVP